MSATKIIGILLIVAGTLALIYGGFSYTREKHDVKLGPLQFSVAEKETVSVPVWAGAGAIAVGVILLVVGRKR
jgi:drug/metabolite transporter (DMT)-like permease